MVALVSRDGTLLARHSCARRCLIPYRHMSLQIGERDFVLDGGSRCPIGMYTPIDDTPPARVTSESARTGWPTTSTGQQLECV